MTKKCICQICTCGRHKCPHYPRGGPISVEPCTISEYTNRYQAHQIEARKNFKPDNKPVHSDVPLDDQTTQRVDYVPHPMERPYQHQPDKYEKPTGDFDMTTNYNVEFNKKPLEAVKLIRPPESRKILGRFDGLPTYTVDYPRWDVEPRSRYGPDSTYQPNDQPFDGQTNYNREFVKYQTAGMRESMKPMLKPLNSGSFDDSTDYKQSYVKHNLPERFVKEKVAWEAFCVPFDEQSSYKLEFTQKPGCTPASFKPDNKPYSSAAPFEGVTTQNVDYRHWPMEQIKRREHECYKKPEGDMSMDTTTHTDYDRKKKKVPTATLR